MATHFVFRARLDQEAVLRSASDVDFAERNSAAARLKHGYGHALSAGELKRFDATNGGGFPGGDSAAEDNAVPPVRQPCGRCGQFFLVPGQATLEEMLDVRLCGERVNALSGLLGLPDQVGMGFVERGFWNDLPLA